MALDLSSEEQQLVAQFRKTPSNRPKYYSVTQKSDLTISEDFEAYLILQQQSTKQKILSWIRDASKVQTDFKDKDALLLRYCGLRQTDAQARQDVLDGMLNNFDQFKAELLSDGSSMDPSRFAGIVELNLLTRSIQRNLDVMSLARENAFHEGNMAIVAKALATASQNTADTDKELQSWQSVLSIYPGRSSTASAVPQSGLAAQTPSLGGLTG